MFKSKTRHLVLILFCLISSFSGADSGSSYGGFRRGVSSFYQGFTTPFRNFPAFPFPRRKKSPPTSTNAANCQPEAPSRPGSNYLQNQIAGGVMAAPPAAMYCYCKSSAVRGLVGHGLFALDFLDQGIAGTRSDGDDIRWVCETITPAHGVVYGWMTNAPYMVSSVKNGPQIEQSLNEKIQASWGTTAEQSWVNWNHTGKEGHLGAFCNAVEKSGNFRGENGNVDPNKVCSFLQEFPECRKGFGRGYIEAPAGCPYLPKEPEASPPCNSCSSMGCPLNLNQGLLPIGESEL